MSVHSSSSGSSTRSYRERRLPDTVAVNAWLYFCGQNPKKVKSLRAYYTDDDFEASSNNGSIWSWSSSGRGNWEFYFVESSSEYWSDYQADPQVPKKPKSKGGGGRSSRASQAVRTPQMPQRGPMPGGPMPRGPMPGGPPGGPGAPGPWARPPMQMPMPMPPPQMPMGMGMPPPHVDDVSDDDGDDGDDSQHEYGPPQGRPFPGPGMMPGMMPGMPAGMSPPVMAPRPASAKILQPVFSTLRRTPPPPGFGAGGAMPRMAQMPEGAPPVPAGFVANGMRMFGN